MNKLKSCIVLLWIAMSFVTPATADAQELQAKITVNHAQIEGTDASVFDNLQHTLEQFVNERQHHGDQI